MISMPRLQLWRSRGAKPIAKLFPEPRLAYGSSVTLTSTGLAPFVLQYMRRYPRLKRSTYAHFFWDEENKHLKKPSKAGLIREPLFKHVQ